MRRPKSQCKPATKKELEWCKQLEKILLKMPKGLWLYNTGHMNVMKYPPDGHEMGAGIDGTGVNQDNVIYSMPYSINSDGGDW